MGILVKKITKICSVCEGIVTKKVKETQTQFDNRKTCGSEDCVKAARAKKGNNEVCFCGEPSTNTSNPYCCYEHRIIAGKCKMWKIPLSLKAFKAHSTMLEAEQREIDRKFR